MFAPDTRKESSTLPCCHVEKERKVVKRERRGRRRRILATAHLHQRLKVVTTSSQVSTAAATLPACSRSSLEPSYDAALKS